MTGTNLPIGKLFISAKEIVDQSTYTVLLSDTFLYVTSDSVDSTIQLPDYNEIPANKTKIVILKLTILNNRKVTITAIGHTIDSLSSIVVSKASSALYKKEYMIFYGTKAYGQSIMGGTPSFLDMLDTPQTYSGHANQFLKVTSDSTGLTFADGGGGNFIDLTDCPHSYSGQALKGLRVGADATALEFYTISSQSSSDLTRIYTAIDRTVLSTDDIIFADGTVTITLQLSTQRTKPITVFNKGLSTITITRAGSDTIEGNSSIQLISQYSGTTLYPDGTSTYFEM